MNSLPLSGATALIARLRRPLFLGSPQNSEKIVR